MENYKSCGMQHVRISSYHSKKCRYKVTLNIVSEAYCPIKIHTRVYTDSAECKVRVPILNAFYYDVLRKVPDKSNFQNCECESDYESV